MKASRKNQLYQNLRYVSLFILCVVAGIVLMSIIESEKLNNSQTVVEDAKNIISECKGINYADECYGLSFGKLVKKTGIAYTMTVLQKVQNIDNATRNCHFIAHKISQAEVARSPADWLNVLGRVDMNACSRGFFHGTIEGYLQFNPAFELNRKSITDICSAIREKTERKMPESQINSLCSHAVGHILLVQTEGVINDAIKVCKQLSSGLESPCYDGVFMENNNRENLKMHGVSKDLEWNDANASYIKDLCSKYFGSARTSCWSGLSDMYGSVSNGDSRRLYQLCRGAPDLNNQENCYAKGSGFMAFIFAGDGKTSEFTTLCDEGDTEKMTLNCIQQVESYVLNSSLSYSEKLLPFCDHFATSMSDLCYREFVRLLRSRSSKELLNFCNKVSASKKEICFQGNS